MNTTFLASTGNTLVRAHNLGDEWQVTTVLSEQSITCLAVDPWNKGHLYAGTKMDGIQVSENHGETWNYAGLGGVAVRSLAISPHVPGVIYAGCKPVSLYHSQDGGASWRELEGLRRRRQWWWFSPAEPPGLRPYVQALTISPSKPEVMLAGIELGGVLRSEDGGHTWSRHRRGAQRDCHTMLFHHSQGEWAYEGGGGGPAYSQDGGNTWNQPKQGLGMVYGWAVAADPARPEVWYLSASRIPRFLRGEFEPPAHKDGQANAHIYRSSGGAPWERLSGGLPDPLDYMAYALITDPIIPGHLYAGLANGDVWHTQNYGDEWVQLPFNLGGIHNVMITL
jgi:hypothetical protein